MFKKMKGVNVTYVQQGLIYFCCRNYTNEPAEMQRRIVRLCMETAGIDWAALKDTVTTGKSIRLIAMEHSISESVLYRLRKRFYESWSRPMAMADDSGELRTQVIY